MVALTQTQLYGEIDLALSWSERDLPERERTKHVHGSTPISASSCRSSSRCCSTATSRPGGRVSTRSPARGRRSSRQSPSATTRSAATSQRSTASCPGEDTRSRSASARLGLCGDAGKRGGPARPSDRPASSLDVVRAARRGELLHFRAPSRSYPSPGRRCASCSRGRRSARLTTHFDLDFPRTPQQSRTGATSTGAPAARSRSAASSSPATRTTPYAASEPSPRCAIRDGQRSCSTATPAPFDLPAPPDGVFTSPPYPGLIDYHEQHRYAYELLGLDDRREEEIGAAARGTSNRRDRGVRDGIAAVLATRAPARRCGAPVCSWSTTDGALPGDPRACRSPPR